jgi:hypothetical protein
VVVLVVFGFVKESVLFTLANDISCGVFEGVLGVEDGLDPGGCVENACGFVCGNVVIDNRHEHVGGSHVPLVERNFGSLSNHLGRDVMNSGVMFDPLGCGVDGGLANFAVGAVALLPF